MKLTFTLSTVSLVLLAANCVGAADDAPRKPNMVIILSDDCGYTDFSMQSGKLPTPRIDSIATGGVRFTNGYVSGCVCSPSRAGLLTGRYQQRIGHEFNIPPVYGETNGLPLSETLLPAVLKDAGYRTIALGRWHLGYAPKFHPLERGFTDYYGFLQGARSYFPLEKPNRLNQLLRDREPLRGFKGSCFEGGMRVPFAMQWPGVIPPGKVVNDPVIALDLFPTALAAAGIEKSPGKPLDHAS